MKSISILDEMIDKKRQKINEHEEEINRLIRIKKDLIQKKIKVNKSAVEKLNIDSDSSVLKLK